MKKSTKEVIGVVLMCMLLTGCKSSDYEKAVQYQENGEYSEAIEAFNKLDDYKDASSRLEDCQNELDYSNAIQLMNQKDYEAANSFFEKLNNYKDSNELKTQCQEMITAIDAFDEAIDKLKEKNELLDKSIDAANSIFNTSDKALNEELRTTLETSITKVRACKKDVPTLPDSADEINSLTKELEETDYSQEVSELEDLQSEFEKSLKQYAQVNNPSESFVINCLERVQGITGISAATEDNDPNNSLGKAGSYTAAIFFTHQNVDQSEVLGDTILEKGTRGGGQIEVYATPEDATKRNEYLASYDGGFLSSGSHCVIGTIVVRTSDELTASQQKELESNIIEELTKID